jgi:hypothetical protein
LIVVGAAVALNLGVPPPAVPGGSPSPTEPIPTPPASQAVPLTIELGPELLGPWQPTPLDLGGALVGELDAHCLAHSTFARRPSLVVVDARGEGRVRLHYADEDGSYVMCETEPIASEFMVVMSSHGQIEDGPVGYLEMRAPFLTESAYPEYPAFPDYPWVEVIGQAGAGIDQVIAEVSGQPSAVVASMGGDGWFALWFPIAESQTWRLIGLNSAGEEVAELDQPF